MGLFDKKYCDICGERIKFLGNKKLEDGNMCKACAKKLSPWFSDRRHTDVESIKAQLAYRERNREDVKRFHISRELGRNTRVLLDERAGKFMVTDEKNLEEANPDVISLEDVVECTMNVDETEEQLYREGPDGKSEPYNPRRYEYTYRFRMEIVLDHPYIDKIQFRLDNYPLKIEYSDRSLFGTGRFDPTRDSEYREYTSTGEEIVRLLTADRPERTQEQKPCEEAAPREEKPQDMMFCPYCGSRTPRIPGGRCQACGGTLDA